VENIVRNYDHMDFIMHFRLSREITYRLIDQFSISEIFTSLQGALSYFQYDVLDATNISNLNINITINIKISLSQPNLSRWKCNRLWEWEVYCISI